MKSIHHRQAAYMPIKVTKLSTGKIDGIVEKQHKGNSGIKKQTASKHYFLKRTVK